MISKNRKWRAVVWRVFVDSCVVGAGIGLAFMRRDVALPVLIAGLADLTACYATYFAANVTQKNIVSKHYVAELDKSDGQRCDG